MQERICACVSDSLHRDGLCIALSVDKKLFQNCYLTAVNMFALINSDQIRELSAYIKDHYLHTYTKNKKVSLAGVL